MTTIKAQLVDILRQLPSRKHAEVFVSALKDAKQNLKEQDIQNPELSDVLSEVVGVLDRWVEADNYRYADPTDNHKKSKFEDETFELVAFFNKLGFYY